MSYHYGGFAPYVSVAQRRQQAETAIKKLLKKGAVISPVTIEGRKIARTFWGMAWCDNLERYRDFAYRLERGRSYVRNGLVLDLQIAPREISALVSGADLYKVKITIAEVAGKLWKQICADCSGGIDSLVELLQGRFSQAVMTRICQQDNGLFPSPKEIRFVCSCPDHAWMCKHVAAALYGVGARLDDNPELLFSLRAVAAAELLSGLGQVLPAVAPAPGVAHEDLAALFDLDMAEEEPASPSTPPPPARQNIAAPPVAIVKSAAKTTTKRAEKIAPAKQRPQAAQKSPARVTPAKQGTAKPKPSHGATKRVKKPGSTSRTNSQKAKTAIKTHSARAASKR